MIYQRLAAQWLPRYGWVPPTHSVQGMRCWYPLRDGNELLLKNLHSNLQQMIYKVYRNVYKICEKIWDRKEQKGDRVDMDYLWFELFLVLDFVDFDEDEEEEEEEEEIAVASTSLVFTCARWILTSNRSISNNRGLKHFLYYGMGDVLIKTK